MRSGLWMRIRLWALALITAVWAPGAAAQTPGAGKAALVVALDYASDPDLYLDNPPNDAMLVETALEAVGFDVSVVLGVDSPEALRSALVNFSIDAAAAENAVFYFAGHGVQTDAGNLLVTGRDRRGRIEGVTLGEVVTLFRSQDGRRDQYLFLDACRNPLDGNARGFTRFEARAEDRTFVMYSTGLGSFAADGMEANSPFATAFARWLKRPIALTDAVQSIKDDVVEQTIGVQTPWYGSSNLNRVYLGRRPCRDCPEMIEVAGGSFSFGSERGDPDEMPEQRIRVRPFAMAATETTFEAYSACVSAGACRRVAAQPGTHPVTGVDWNDARAFADWVTAQTGRRHYLPTEVQWEYAARGGSPPEWPFHWGPEVGIDNANCDRCNGGRIGAPIAVQSFRANPFGLYDMLGNVNEWTADCYRNRYEEGRSAEIPYERSRCSARVVRGGSYAQRPMFMRIENRNKQPAKRSAQSLGFRLAADPLD